MPTLRPECAMMLGSTPTLISSPADSLCLCGGGGGTGDCCRCHGGGEFRMPRIGRTAAVSCLPGCWLPGIGDSPRGSLLMFSIGGTGTIALTVLGGVFEGGMPGILRIKSLRKVVQLCNLGELMGSGLLIMFPNDEVDRFSLALLGSGFSVFG